MTVNEKTIFLVDGMGAGVSVMILGVVLPAYQPFIGMPTKTLYLLAALPAVFAIYDVYCYRRVNLAQAKWLRRIILANFAYCMLSGFAMVWYFDQLTPWGIAYFAAEFIVIMGLVFYEAHIYRDAYSAGNDQS